MDQQQNKRIQREFIYTPTPSTRVLADGERPRCHWRPALDGLSALQFPWGRSTEDGATQVNEWRVRARCNRAFNILLLVSHQYSLYSLTRQYSFYSLIIISLEVVLASLCCRPFGLLDSLHLCYKIFRWCAKE